MTEFKMEAEEILAALDRASICTFMYYPQKKSIYVPQNTCTHYQCHSSYSNMPKSFADDFVFEEDRNNFYAMYERIDRGAHSSSATFRNKDISFTCHVTLTTVEWDKENRPLKTLGIIEDISEAFRDEQLLKQFQSNLSTNDLEENYIEEAKTAIASAIGGQYYAIYYIWLKEHNYVCFREQLPGVLSAIGARGDYDSAWDTYVAGFVDEEDREVVRNFADIETLGQRLKNTNALSHEYRRKNVGWTRGMFIAAKKDEAGNVINAIYTVSDINREKAMELSQAKALYEACHDALTGVYNRNGFEDVIRNETIREMPVGFALVDIDNFKSLNDTFGHEVGDRVLSEVAGLLKAMFRSDDDIFRVGGDEFAILLHEGTEEIWQSICRKQQTIHNALSKAFSNTSNLAVTLSIGLSFSSKGYHSDLYQLADEALYETKKRGRAGCTMIGEDHIVKNHWRDDNISLQAQSALEFNNTAVFRIEYAKGEKPRMVCGEATRLLLGVGMDMSSQDCFTYWFERIDSEYRQAIHNVHMDALKGKQAECTYRWNHPKYGWIYIRTVGFGEIKEGMEILTGYHHSLRDTTIITKQDDNELLISALSNIYFCSYYLNLANDTYATFKVAPGEDYLQMEDGHISENFNEFIDVIVSEEDREKMRGFTDLTTLEERLENERYIDCEYRSLIKQGWCRARFLPIKSDQNGKLTHVLFTIAALDAHKSKELDADEYNKRSLAAVFNNVPGGIIMYEWDGKQLKTLHISDYYARLYGGSLVSTAGENKGGPDFVRVHPDDVEEYQKAIYEALTKTHRLEYVYRVWNNESDQYVWIKISAIADPQPNGTSLVYAMYSDVNEQVEAERSLAKSKASLRAALNASNLLSYEYDPIEHTGICFGDTNAFNLPRVIENYPESLRDFEAFHPDDVELFIKTAHRMDHGIQQAKCDIRARKTGENYGWYSCTFDAYYDEEKGRTVAILTVVDISDRMAMTADFEQRIQILLNRSESSLTSGSFNLTRNTYRNGNTAENMKGFILEDKTFEELMMNAADSVIGEIGRKTFKELFNRKHLLECFKQGEFHISLNHLFRTNGETMWLETAVDMVHNPITDEIEGVCYSRSIRDERFSNLLLKNTLRQDYPMLAIIVADTGEFIMYDTKLGVYGERRVGYWDMLAMAMKPMLAEEDRDHLAEEMNRDAILKTLDDGDEYSRTFNSIYGDRSQRMEIRYSYLDKDSRILLAALRNITDSTLMNRYRYESEHDPLTGLYNRSALFKKCRSLLERYPDELFVMVHVDMKNFHLYNTFFGDEAGDELLKTIADLFRQLDRDYTHWAYGRMESDVFCAMSPYDEKLFHRHVTYVLDCLKNYSDNFVIEPRIGLYRIEDKTMPISAMYTRASMASKQYRTEMGDTPMLYTPTMEAALNEKQEIINRMHAAIENEEFIVYLQPKYNLRTAKPCGAEALVRWRDPQKGLISPAKFIPIFESNGFIAELDKYMWKHVCVLLKKWQKEGKATPISVNVSRISMYAPSTVQYLKDLVKEYEIDPRLLELELTETAYLDDPEEMKAQLKELRNAGFKILMDDFGSGYSSLNTLKDLPVDQLKLDMKFMIKEEDRRANIVLSSIVRMAKMLGLPVIAEGVETRDQADYLESIGCEYVQGYFFARPMPVEEFEVLLRSIEKEKEVKPAGYLFRPDAKRLIADTREASQALGSLLPIPVALVEYHNGNYLFLRTNPAFMEAFGLLENMNPASLAFKEHLINHDRFVQALFEAVKTETTQRCLLQWSEEGKEKQFETNIGYDGKVDDEELLLVTFTEVNY